MNKLSKETGQNRMQASYVQELDVAPQPFAVKGGPILQSTGEHYVHGMQSTNSEIYGDRQDDGKWVYFVNARMTLAEMWRKKMDAMKERESTRTMNGSLIAEASAKLR